jgi:hypothetical protein
MKKSVVIGLLLLTALMSSIWGTERFVKAPPPPGIPMNIEGYVIMQGINGSNMTTPAGLNVTARQNATIYNVNGSLPTDVNGYYSIGVYGPTDGSLIDIWVQEINVTQMIFHTGGIIDETNGGNLTLTRPLNHDLKVDMKDIGASARAFSTLPGDTLWNPHADITGPEQLVPDGKVDMRDISLVVVHFGERYP